MFGGVTDLVVSKGLHDSGLLFLSLTCMAPATVQVPSLGLVYFLGIPYLK